MKILGKLARLTSKQTNRRYFSEIPIGTLFIIVDEIDTPAYDITGLFLGIIPQVLGNGDIHSTGYIEKNTWELVGDIEDNIELIKK